MTMIITYPPFRQWAAVRTHCESMSEPPQDDSGPLPLSIERNACQGNSLIDDTVVPPMIRPEIMDDSTLVNPKTPSYSIQKCFLINYLNITFEWLCADGIKSNIRWFGVPFVAAGDDFFKFSSLLARARRFFSAFIDGGMAFGTAWFDHFIYQCAIKLKGSKN